MHQVREECYEWHKKKYITWSKTTIITDVFDVASTGANDTITSIRRCFTTWWIKFYMLWIWYSWTPYVVGAIHTTRLSSDHAIQEWFYWCHVTGIRQGTKCWKIWWYVVWWFILSIKWNLFSQRTHVFSCSYIFSYLHTLYDWEKWKFVYFIDRTLRTHRERKERTRRCLHQTDFCDIINAKLTTVMQKLLCTSYTTNFNLRIADEMME